jgi:hypothetical protein
LAIAGSPKKLAQDISEGYLSLSPPLLKNYTPADCKIVVAHLAMVGRELRGEQISLDDVMALKSKNMKLSRLHQAEVVLRAYCKKKRIPL